MPVDEILMSLGVEYLGVIGIFGVTYVIALGFHGVDALGVPGKVDLWVPSKVFILVPDVSMFTIFSSYLLRSNPYL